MFLRLAKIMDYKDEFYAKYFSAHISHRKGKATLDIFRQRSAAWQKNFGRFLPKDKNAKIIDVGCGNGALVWWLQQVGFSNAEGVDISSEQIKIAQALGVNNVKQTDLRSYLKAKTCFYDIIILRDVIEHFRKEEIIEILEICYNSLKNAGRIIIQVPNAESPFFGRIRYGDFTHEIAFSSSSLSQLLNIIGLTKVQFYAITPTVSGARSLIRFLLWKVVEVFYKFLLYAEIGRGKRIVTQGIIAVATKKVGASDENKNFD